MNIYNEIPLIVYEEIDSTNNEAKRQIELAAAHESVLLAKGQTAGRGRVGHSFFSKKDRGLFFTYIYKVNSGLENCTTCTTKAAVAVYRAIKRIYEIETDIKWVNDIYYNERKIAGILVEIAFDPIDKSPWIIAGIGINDRAQDFPEEIKDLAGYLPKEDCINRNEFLAEIIKNLKQEFDLMENMEYLSTYREHQMLINKWIRFEQDGVEKKGFVETIDDEAGLVIVTSENEKKVLRNGEVFEIRKIDKN